MGVPSARVWVKRGLSRRCWDHVRNGLALRDMGTLRQQSLNVGLGYRASAGLPQGRDGLGGGWPPGIREGSWMSLCPQIKEGVLGTPGEWNSDLRLLR